jgi:ubiquinone/menaquinone biosynthesis C-methylase UbiE
MPMRALLGVVVLAALFQSCNMDMDWREDEENNNLIQPPAEVMDRIGVKEGMVIGEFGAGYGRFTVPLAGRVGESGLVYANEIDGSLLSYIDKRCKRAGLKNVRAILGQVDDPLFPDRSLDMAFSSLVYHEIENPVVFLKNLIPALKPDASIIIVDNDPKINNESSNVGREWPKEFEAAGLEMVGTERLKDRDVMFILKVRGRS